MVVNSFVVPKASRLPALLAALLAVLGASACASPRAPSDLRSGVPSDVTLVGPHGERVDVERAARASRFTVLVFFSLDCHCFAAHEERLRALYREYVPRGVTVWIVDSEVRASRARDDAEAERRGLPFPILLDPGGKLADRLGAEYATYSVVLDAEARVRYSGGIDSDKTHLRADATPYLRDALDDLLAGRPPRLAVGKALGCALERW
ncbi:MAG TPA: redoxin domain-containing protein [Polyangiaceae bacterium]|nr:redoxin domain-containing protein [Polyangiaceae bacterium]